MLDHIKAVLFDLDGTLVDSMWMWGNIDIEFLGQNGFEVPEDFARCIEGMSFTETAVYVKKRFNLSLTVDAIKNPWNEMADFKYQHEVHLKDGGFEFINELKKRGIKTGIATSNSKELVKKCVEANQLFDCFDCIKTACEVKRGKPAPDIYLAVAEDLGVKPEECLVFEDIPNGIKAGKSAGMKVCAIYDEFSKERESEIKELADYYIVSFKQVLDGTYEKLH